MYMNISLPLNLPQTFFNAKVYPFILLLFKLHVTLKMILLSVTINTSDLVLLVTINYINDYVS